MGHIKVKFQHPNSLQRKRMLPQEQVSKLKTAGTFNTHLGYLNIAHTNFSCFGPTLQEVGFCLPNTKKERNYVC